MSGTCGGTACYISCSCKNGWTNVSTSYSTRATGADSYYVEVTAPRTYANGTPTCRKTVTCADYGYVSSLSSGYYGRRVTVSTDGASLTCYDTIGTCTHSVSGISDTCDTSCSSNYYSTGTKSGTRTYTYTLDQSSYYNNCTSSYTSTSGITCQVCNQCSCSWVNDGSVQCASQPADTYANGKTSGTQPTKYTCNGGKACSSSHGNTSSKTASNACTNWSSCNCSKVDNGSVFCSAKPGSDYYANGTTSGTQSKKWSCASTSCSSHGTSAGSVTVANACTNWSSCNCSKVNDGSVSCADNPGSGYYANGKTSGTQKKKWSCASSSCSSHGTSAGSVTVANACTNYSPCPTSKSCSNGCKTEKDSPCGGKICTECKPNCTYKEAVLINLSCPSGPHGSMTYDPNIPVRADGKPECGGFGGVWGTGECQKVQYPNENSCGPIYGDKVSCTCYTCDVRGY